MTARRANSPAASNATTGIAIEARKQQGEASTAIFPAHLSASLGQVGRIVSAAAPYFIGHISEHTGLGYALSSSSAAFLLAALIAMLALGMYLNARGRWSQPRGSLRLTVWV